MPKQIITFDFDDTLCMEDGTPNLPMMELVRQHAAEGFKCYVVTARNKAHESLRWINKTGSTRVRVKDFINEHDLPIKQCHFTNHALKGPILKQIGSIRHYDDHDEQLASATEHGIEAIRALSPQ
jgi:acid phosphatase class B